MTVDIAKLRRLEQAATPGPYRIYRCSYAEDGDACGIRSAKYPIDKTYGADVFHDAAYDECHHIVSIANAELLIESRNALPALLDEIEALRARLELITKRLYHVRDDIDQDCECRSWTKEIDDALRIAEVGE